MRAPRGTAIRSGSIDLLPADAEVNRRSSAPPPPLLLLHLGDVDALQVEREAGRRQVEPEALRSGRRSGRRRRAWPSAGS